MKNKNIVSVVRKGNRLESGSLQACFYFCACKSGRTTTPAYTFPPNDKQRHEYDFEALHFSLLTT